jgi:hypothetical protein
MINCMAASAIVTSACLLRSAASGRSSRSAWCGDRLPGWVLWSIAHIYFLIGFGNRLVVALNWAWNYLTFQRGSRLITGLYVPQLQKMG